MNQDEGTRAATSQFFIVEFDLNELSSHFFNQVLGFKLAAEERGFVPRVILSRHADRTLAETLDGHRLIELGSMEVKSFQDQLDAFAEGDRQLQSLWNAVEAMGVSSNDILLITSSRPVVIYSVGAWLGRLNPARRPAVFIRFFSHEYLDLEKMDYGEPSWLHQFAARKLWLNPGQERVYFTVNNEKMILPLARLCARRVFQMPLPKYYGNVSSPSRAGTDAPVIYTHLNIRSGVMLDQVDLVLHAVLDKYPDAKFLLKYTRNALPRGKDRRLDGALSARGVELVPSEQSHADHIATIARSDIVFLPYEATEYAALASGIFAEAAALGKVIVYPDNTWMAEEVTLGHAVGAAFADANHVEASAAILRTLDALTEMSTIALARSHEFRALHSCGRNLDLMSALAADKHDMALRCTSDSRIRFDEPLQPRGYLGCGWSSYERPGIWSDGPVAEVFLHVEPLPSRSLDVHFLLTPFFSKGRPQTVIVSAGGVELCTWNFPWKRARNPRWCKITIPLRLIPSGEVRLQLHVKDPHSPRQAGISDDERALGVMLSEIRLGRRWRLPSWLRQTATPLPRPPARSRPDAD